MAGLETFIAFLILVFFISRTIQIHIMLKRIDRALEPLEDIRRLLKTLVYLQNHSPEDGEEEIVLTQEVKRDEDFLESLQMHSED